MKLSILFYPNTKKTVVKTGKVPMYTYYLKQKESRDAA